MAPLTLHGYFRSSASYRVRIVLNLKRVAYRSVVHHLGRGEQRESAYLALNPQGLVPALEVDGAVLTQSLAICEYLDEAFPDPPLFPRDPLARARVRAFALAIACEVHPLQNIGVIERLRRAGLEEGQVRAWPGAVIAEGLAACSALIADESGPFCFGEDLTLADVLLVPQLANARRYGVDVRWPRLLEAESACLALDAVRRARPENQPDAE